MRLSAVVSPRQACPTFASPREYRQPQLICMKLLTDWCSGTHSSTKGATGISLMLSTFWYSAWRITSVRRSLLGALGLFILSAMPTQDVSPVRAQTAVAQTSPLAQPSRKPSRREDLELAASNWEQRAKAEKDSNKRAE